MACNSMRPESYLNHVSIPGDYEFSMKVARMKNFQKMHAEEPSTQEVCDGVKFGPCKFDLAEEWAASNSMDWEACDGDARKVKRKQPEAQRQKNTKKLSWKARTVRVYHVLYRVARRLHRKKLKIWIEACNRSVSHKLGPVMFLKKMRIIQKVSEKPVRQDSLDLSEAGGQGQWVMRPLLKNVPTPIEEMMRMADSMEKLKLPSTVAQMGELLKVAEATPGEKLKRQKKRRRKAAAKVDGKGYVRLWFLRARATRMLHVAHRQLQLKESTIAQLAEVFPDTGGWMQKFSQVLGLVPKETLAKTMLQKMGYCGEPHVFSMWCCLFADRALTAATPEDVENKSQAMEKFALQHRQKHGIWPHPAQAYTTVKKSAAGEKAMKITRRK